MRRISWRISRIRPISVVARFHCKTQWKIACHKTWNYHKHRFFKKCEGNSELTDSPRPSRISNKKPFSKNTKEGKTPRNAKLHFTKNETITKPFFFKKCERNSELTDSHGFRTTATRKRNFCPAVIHH